MSITRVNINGYRYVIECDQCARQAQKTGTDEFSAAAKARALGYQAIYVNPNASAIWLCESCSRSPSI